MTLFHLLLVRLLDCGAVTVHAAYALAAVRVALCPLPQNRWLSGETPAGWGVARNVPFLAIGLVEAAGFIMSPVKGGPAVGALILASFACYLPVVLWADKKPALGMLMLPKSVAYVMILVCGLAFKQ